MKLNERGGYRFDYPYSDDPALTIIAVTVALLFEVPRQGPMVRI